MQMKPKNNCPLNGFAPCKELECGWFIKVAGSNPNTGAEIEEWGCAVAWLPIMLIENAHQQKQTGAAVESFRNEMVKSNDFTANVLLQAQQQARLTR
jgi:hypothetical protein